MKLAEEYKIVPVMSNHAMGTNPSPTDSINMKNYHRCTFLIDTGTMAGADFTVTVWSGATNGAYDSQLYFDYAVAGSTFGGATADVLAAASKVNTLLLAHATYDNWMIIVDVDAADMDVANQENWLTLRFADNGTTGDVTVFAILEPRFSQARSATALA